MGAKFRVTVDHELCVGNAMCSHIAGQVFRLNAARQSEVIDPEGGPGEVALTAAEACPVSAITVVDAETGERLFP